MALLTVPDEDAFAVFDVTSADASFPITFALFAKADLRILVDGAELDQSDFTFTGTLLDGGGYDGGTVDLNTAAANCRVIIWRDVDATRTTNFSPATSVPVRSMDLALNRLTAQVQELKQSADRSLRTAPGTTVDQLEAPDSGVGLVGIDSDGEIHTYSSASLGASINATSYMAVLVAGTNNQAGLQTAVGIPSWMSTLLTSASLAAFKAKLGIFRICPLASPYNATGDGVTDDLVAWQTAMQDATALAAVVSGETCMVVLDGGCKPARFIAGPLVGRSGVHIDNVIGLFSTVAKYTNDYGDWQAWVIWEGTIAASATSTLQESTRKGSQACVINNTSLAADDLVLVDHVPPETTLTAQLAAGAVTLTVGSNAAFPSGGYLLVGNEVIAVRSKISTTGWNIRATTGRARHETTDTTWPVGTRVTYLHGGHFHHSRSPIAYRIAEMNYVREVPRALSTGKYSLLLRHAIEHIYSSTYSGRVRKVTPVKNVGLGPGVHLIGSSTQVPSVSSASEVGFMARYVDGLLLNNPIVEKCSDAHGLIDSCVNVAGSARLIGKALGSSRDGHYGLSLVNACRWINLRVSEARNLYKLVTLWASGISSAATYHGTPCDVSITAGQMWNCGNPDDNAHEPFECHSWCERVQFLGNSASDAAGGISWEGGRDLSWRGGRLGRWSRQAIGCDGTFAMLGLKVTDTEIGERTLLGAGTNLTSNITNVATTLTVDAAAWITDATAPDATDVLVKIGSELIKLGTHTGSGTFTGCTRAMSGTTAAAHTAADRVYAMGNAYATPVDLDLTHCRLFMDDPDKFATTVQVAVVAGDTSINVLNIAAFPDPGPSGVAYAEIENTSTVDSHCTSEIISYTGKSASSGVANLTGVTRGLYGTTDAAHAQYMLIQPFTPAIADIDIGGFDLSLDIVRTFISIRGAHPSFNCRLRGVGQTWKGDMRHNTYSSVIYPHRWNVSGNGSELVDLPYGYSLLGNLQKVTDIAGGLSLPDSTGGGLISVSGSRCKVNGIQAHNYYLAGRIETGAVKSSIRNSVGTTINSGTEGVSDAGTTSDVAQNKAIA